MAIRGYGLRHKALNALKAHPVEAGRPVGLQVAREQRYGVVAIGKIHG